MFAELASTPLSTVAGCVEFPGGSEQCSACDYTTKAALLAEIKEKEAEKLKLEQQKDAAESDEEQSNLNDQIQELDEQIRSLQAEARAMEEDAKVSCTSCTIGFILSGSKCVGKYRLHLWLSSKGVYATPLIEKQRCLGYTIN